MRRVRKFLRLAPGDKVLLLKTTLLLALVRLGLSLLPFRHLQSILAPLLNPRRRESKQPDVDMRRVARAVTTGARYVPGASCLTQGLTAQALLSGMGLPSRLQIGVTRNAQREFAAHAWVICDGQVVVGGAGHEVYTPLVAWEGPQR